MARTDSGTADERPCVDADASSPHRRWRRVLLAALLAGGLALVLAGGAGAVASRVLADGAEPLPRCPGPGTPGCNQGADVDAVVAVLEERGYECDRGTRDPDGDEHREFASCELTDGGVLADRYSAALHSVNGVVYGFDVQLTHRAGLPLTPHRMAFLTWFAVLPFGAEPESAAAAEEWLRDRLEAGAGGTTTVGAYEYELFFPWTSADIRLTASGLPGWWTS